MTDTPDPRDHRYFFIHVMKTAGFTFVQHMRFNFDLSEMYPDIPAGPRRQALYFDPETLLAKSKEELDAYQVINGHFHAVVAEMVDPDRLTITLLRDPVDRAVSALGHLRAADPALADVSLEEIYETETLRVAMFVQDFQVKTFAAGADDPLNMGHGLEITPERMDAAKQRLSNMDVVGFQDDLPAVLDVMVRHFGWRTRDPRSRNNKGDAAVASDALRQQIAANNPRELEFYEFARELVEQRTADGIEVLRKGPA